MLHGGAGGDGGGGGFAGLRAAGRCGAAGGGDGTEGLGGVGSELGGSGGEPCEVCDGALVFADAEEGLSVPTKRKFRLSPAQTSPAPTSLDTHKHPLADIWTNGNKSIGWS